MTPERSNTSQTYTLHALLGPLSFPCRDSKLLGETFWCNQHITSLDLAHASMQTDAAKELARVIARPHGTLLSLNLSR